MYDSFCSSLLFRPIPLKWTRVRLFSHVCECFFFYTPVFSSVHDDGKSKISVTSGTPKSSPFDRRSR